MSPEAVFPARRPPSRGLSWGLYQLDGTFLGPVTNRLSGSRVDIALNGHRQATLRLSLYDPLAALIEPLAVVLRAWLDGGIVFAGTIQEPTFHGSTGVVECPATGPSRRLERAFVGQRSDGAGLTGHPPLGTPPDPTLLYRQEQVPEGEIMARLVEHALPTAAEMAAGVPGLELVRGDIHGGNLRDRTYDAGKQIWEAVGQLADVIDGADFDIRPINDRTFPAVLGALDTMDRMGADLSGSVVLEYGVGANTAADLTYKPSGDIINRMTGVGEAPPYDGEGEAPLPPRYTADQPASQVGYGLYCEYAGLPGISDLATLAERVGGVVSTQAFPVDHFDVVPALQDGTGWVRDAGGEWTQMRSLGRPPLFGPGRDWWIGDSFSVIGLLGSRPITLNGRAVGASIEEVDAAGNVQVTVQSVPRVISVVSA